MRFSNILYSICTQSCNNKMKKRRLDINQVKKLALKNRQTRTITTKYEVMLSFFKKKDDKPNPIFSVHLEQLVSDLIDQLSNAEITYKLENQLQGEIHAVKIVADSLEFNISCLKNICKEFPIPEIMECIEIKRDQNTRRIGVSIVNAKLMVFFKHLRTIFPEFCYSTGEKTIVEANQLRTFYETFKCQWNKIYERGRMDNCQKIEKLLCRSLYFLGALIQNNIFYEIAEEERLKKQEAADISTKSQKKPAFKLLTHQVSSTYSFGGQFDLLSNLSSGMISQKSNRESFCKTGGYSERSEKLVARGEKDCKLWQRAEIKDLKIGVKATNDQQKTTQAFHFQIDLLSNDVENILIEQAFKIERLKIESSRFMSLDNSQYPYNNYHPGYYPQQYYTPNYYSPLIYTQSPKLDQSRSNKRTNNHSNLVETRKTHSRLEGYKNYP